jgi:hypothetical protein
MIRGTTPTHIFTLPFDVSVVGEVEVTYSQNDAMVLQKKTEDCVLEKNTISLKLSQEDTFKFDGKRHVVVQVRILTVDDNVMASQIEMIPIGECLSDEVI